MSSTSDNFARDVCRLAFLFMLGGWIGSMVFFAAVTAPAAFAATASLADNGHQVAGSVVRISLGVLNVAGYVLAPMCMSLLFAGESAAHRFTRVVGILMISLAAIGLVSIVSHGAITSRLDDLRSAMGVIDSVAPSDPLRIEFNRLHKVSVGLLAFQLLAAIGTFVAVGWRWLGESRGPHSSTVRSRS